tara:strand:- start:2950 stop:3270 length:321 start_codon:yes stop_codon:yes gene_type:complete
MAEPKYKVVNGEYVELTAEEIQELEDRAAAADLDFTMVRGQRDGMLRNTDWTQIADAALGDHTAEEWAAYRQELRDLPAGFSKVSEVVWPDDPPTAAAKAAEEAAE